MTDFLKPVFPRQSERSYLWFARAITLVIGILGTVTGLFFVDPSIKSLFDQFVGILGLFLGVLAGLFVLGTMTRRANSAGSLCGATFAIVLMAGVVFAANRQSLLGFDVRGLFDAWGIRIYELNGYLYAFVSISACFTVGYLASWFFPEENRDLSGLTLWDPIVNSSDG